MATTVCLVCGCKVLEGGVTKCPRCDTTHHQDCWTYNAGCAVYACNPNTKAVMVDKPGAGGSPVRAIALGLAFMGAVAAGLAFFTNMFVVYKTADPRPETPVVHQTDSSVAMPFVGHKAPEFSIRDLDGKVQSISEIRKGRVMILSFWLAHCADCMPHMPAWADIYKRYEENSEVVLVNVAAYANDPEPIKDFCKQNGIGGRVLLDGVNQAVPAYQLGTITTFVIDNDGVIRLRESQAGTTADRVAPLVEKLLAAHRAR